MFTLCSAITKKGKQCANKIREPEKQCETHKRECNAVKLLKCDNYMYHMLVEDLEEHIRHNNSISKRNETLNAKKFRQENFPSGISENIAKFVLWKFLGIRPNWNTFAGDLEITFVEENKILRIEVKGFSAIAPSSFGPGEKWDWIVFVDCIEYKDRKFKVFLMKFANSSETWRSLKMRKDAEVFDASTSPHVPDNLGEMTATALKNLCKKRCIDAKGDKETLIRNLKTLKAGSCKESTRTYGQIADENKRGDLRHNFYGGIRPQFNEESCKLIFDGNLSELKDIETQKHTPKMMEFTEFLNSVETNMILDE